MPPRRTATSASAARGRRSDRRDSRRARTSGAPHSGRWAHVRPPRLAPVQNRALPPAVRVRVEPVREHQPADRRDGAANDRPHRADGDHGRGARSAGPHGKPRVPRSGAGAQGAGAREQGDRRHVRSHPARLSREGGAALRERDRARKVDLGGRVRARASQGSDLARFDPGASECPATLRPCPRRSSS